MDKCKPNDAHIANGDKFSKDQCLENEIHKSLMKDRPYFSVVCSLMYAQVCTSPYVSFVVSVLGRYLFNLDDKHWIAIKRVIIYLQKTKDYMLVYIKVNDLEVTRYIDLNFIGYVEDMKSISSFVFLLASGLSLGKV